MRQAPVSKVLGPARTLAPDLFLANSNTLQERCSHDIIPSELHAELRDPPADPSLPLLLHFLSTSLAASTPAVLASSPLPIRLACCKYTSSARVFSTSYPPRLLQARQQCSRLLHFLSASLAASTATAPASSPLPLLQAHQHQPRHASSGQALPVARMVGPSRPGGTGHGGIA
eukprot:242424-Chlamydomonas_euryale.AAC.8